MSTTRHETKLRIEKMRRVPLFAGCTSDQLARIDRLGARIEVDAGRALTRQGTSGRECFVTLAGTAVAVRDGSRPVMFDRSDMPSLRDVAG